MTPEIWIALAVANFASAAAPGQNVALVGSATVRGGVAGGLSATGGILVAEVVWSFAALLLVIGAREIDPMLWGALRVGSGVFLLAYGVSMLRRVSSGTADVVPVSGHHGRIAARGFWVGLANPITLVFFLSIFPIFVPADVSRITPPLVAFCGSAAALSAATALVPYVMLSNLLARRGLGRMLERASGGALVMLGSLVILRAAC